MGTFAVSARRGLARVEQVEQGPPPCPGTCPTYSSLYSKSCPGGTGGTGISDVDTKDMAKAIQQPGEYDSGTLYESHIENGWTPVPPVPKL